MEFGQKNYFREIDLFDFMSCLPWTFLFFWPTVYFKALKITFRVKVGISAAQKPGSKSGNQGHNKGQE